MHPTKRSQELVNTCYSALLITINLKWIGCSTSSILLELYSGLSWVQQMDHWPPASMPQLPTFLDCCTAGIPKGLMKCSPWSWESITHPHSTAFSSLRSQQAWGQLLLLWQPQLLPPVKCCFFYQSPPLYSRVCEYLNWHMPTLVVLREEAPASESWWEKSETDVSYRRCCGHNVELLCLKKT